MLVVLNFGKTNMSIFFSFFLGAKRDDKLCIQNIGVHVPGAGDIVVIDFYGKLTSMVQLIYKDCCQVILFKCHWFDTNPSRNGSVKRDDGLPSVNTTRCWLSHPDPRIKTIHELGCEP